MAVTAAGNYLAAARPVAVRRDGSPQEAKHAPNPKEPFGKDYVAASGNAVGQATGNSVSGIMKLVRNPEVAVAAVSTAAFAAGGAVIGFLFGRGAGAAQGAKLGVTMGGGVGMVGAGLIMTGDSEVNTYAKTLVAPMLVSVGGGLVIGSLNGLFGWEGGTVAQALARSRTGAHIGSMIGAGVSAIATGIKGCSDVIESFGARLGGKPAQ
ncbi:MAG: hypothetical protein FJZ01_10530 [Candidatus Sericytochromatia bacterium]|nr:hypothetical protein [Candidatus Tanganyikabacteria bacterium]